jgi:hypothetical protein
MLRTERDYELEVVHTDWPIAMDKNTLDAYRGVDVMFNCVIVDGRRSGQRQGHAPAQV